MCYYRGVVILTSESHKTILIFTRFVTVSPQMTFCVSPQTAGVLFHFFFAPAPLDNKNPPRPLSCARGLANTFDRDLFIYKLFLFQKLALQWQSDKIKLYPLWPRMVPPPSPPTIVLQYIKHEFTELQQYNISALTYKMPYMYIIQLAAISHLLQQRPMPELSLLHYLLQDIGHWVQASEWGAFHLKATFLFFVFCCKACK